MEPKTKKSEHEEELKEKREQQEKDCRERRERESKDRYITRATFDWTHVTERDE